MDLVDFVFQIAALPGEVWNAGEASGRSEDVEEPAVNYPLPVFENTTGETGLTKDEEIALREFEAAAVAEEITRDRLEAEPQPQIPTTPGQGKGENRIFR